MFKRDLGKESFTFPYVLKHYEGKKSENECRLIAYNIDLKSDSCDLFKLEKGINLTLKYPSDIAKEWDKYNYKVYHFKDFDYKAMKYLNSPDIEGVKCTADKNGIHFNAPGFSIYAISVTTKSGNTGSPKTGESSVGLNIVLLIVLISVAGITGVIAKRRGELIWAK